MSNAKIQILNEIQMSIRLRRTNLKFGLCPPRRMTFIWHLSFVL